MTTRIDGCGRIYHLSYHDEVGGPRQAVLGDIHPLVFAVHAWTDSGHTPRTLQVTAFSVVDPQALPHARAVALAASQPGGMPAYTLDGMLRRIAERLRPVQERNLPAVLRESERFRLVKDLNLQAALRESEEALRAYALGS